MFVHNLTHRILFLFFCFAVAGSRIVYNVNFQKVSNDKLLLWPQSVDAIQIEWKALSIHGMRVGRGIAYTSNQLPNQSIAVTDSICLVLVFSNVSMRARISRTVFKTSWERSWSDRRKSSNLFTFAIVRLSYIPYHSNQIPSIIRCSLYDFCWLNFFTMSSIFMYCVCVCLCMCVCLYLLCVVSPFFAIPQIHLLKSHLNLV